MRLPGPDGMLNGKPYDYYYRPAPTILYDYFNAGISDYYSPRHNFNHPGTKTKDHLADALDNGKRKSPCSCKVYTRCS